MRSETDVALILRRDNSTKLKDSEPLQTVRNPSLFFAAAEI
jgi:hypothetical protein